jgi:solute carrier family 25 oxoglutarate transporter 11
MASVQAQPQVKHFSSGQQFLFGGLAGMVATCIVQPVDLIKTRMQLSATGQHKNSFDAFTTIARQEGFRNLYKGLTAALFRQATYSSTRLGVYNTILENLSEKDPKMARSFAVQMGCGCLAGGIGAVIGTPAEVALIRMTSDGRLPPEQRRNYKNVFDALARIVREEGVMSMWKGCGPTVTRAVILNAAQLGVYSQAKQLVTTYTKIPDGIPTHLTASMAAGFVATAVSIPVDLAKTTLQAQKPLPDGTLEYKGSADVLVKTVQKHGVLRLWRGFSPYFLRLGPHTVITFLTLEQFKKHFGH